MASHIGKLPVTIPAGVEVAIEGQNFSAKGAKGSDSYVIPEGITAQVEGNEIILTAADDLRPTRAKHGLSRSIIASMVKGVHDGFEKRLLIVGTGYRAVAKGKGIEINTSGLRQAYGDTFPNLECLKLYRDLGGEILTIGSDAHSNLDLGKGIAQGLDIARAAGFTNIAYFEKHEPQFLKLAD